jgi:hypothetical protein
MTKFTLEQAKELAGKLKVDFEKAGFTPEEFLEGLHIELEHGLVDPDTNVTDDNPLTTAKIVMAHLNENPMYYDDNIGLEAWEHALDKVKGDTTGKKIMIV